MAPSSSRRKGHNRSWRPATRLVHGGTVRSQFGETSEAIFATSGYVYARAQDAEARFKGEADGFLYSRFGNPTVRMFEERMMALEGAGDARATTTGMAAVMASMFCFLKAGDHVLSARSLFSSCRYIIETLLPRFGVETTLIDGRSLAAWRAGIRPNTKAFFLETPSNPVLELIDIAAVAKLARQARARLIVDNVFATPILQKPLELGAHIVVYSATKHIDGHGRLLGGIVLSDKKFITDYLGDYVRQTGPSLSPFNAWGLLKSVETLPLRVAQHTQSAKIIADYLAEHKKITRVYYPYRRDHPQYAIAKKQMSGGGPLVAFELKGDKRQAFRFMNALRLIKISNNLGDAKSLITHPATTTHYRLQEAERQEANIFPNSIRLSVGLEDVADLQDDLAQALAYG